MTKELIYNPSYSDLLGDIELMLQLPTITKEVGYFLASYMDENILEYKNS